MWLLSMRMNHSQLDLDLCECVQTLIFSKLLVKKTLTSLLGPLGSPALKYQQTSSTTSHNAAVVPFLSAKVMWWAATHGFQSQETLKQIICEIWKRLLVVVVVLVLVKPGQLWIVRSPSPSLGKIFSLTSKNGSEAGKEDCFVLMWW